MTDTLDARQTAIRELIEENAALDDLQRHPGWAIYTRYVNLAKQEFEKRLASGNLSSIEDYKLCAGRCDGMRQMLDIPDLRAKALALVTADNEAWVDEFSPADALTEYPQPTIETGD